MLKLAILGASGIGFYHAREFANAGCDITAILGSSEESSIKTALRLKEQFNINPKPYHNLDELLSKETLDAVSICTPPEFHSKHVEKCLEAGLHVFCEKPFSPNKSTAEYLINLAKQKGKIISVNTQWVSALKYVPEELKEKTSYFSMFMRPVNFPIEKLPEECIPHFNSLLIKLIPNGKPLEIKTETKNDAINIKFFYQNETQTCEVSYIISSKKEKPTELGFNINKTEFIRELGENYQQYLISGKGTYKIEDPLRASIRGFVSSILKEGNPLVTPNEIISNVALQEEILEVINKK